MCQRSQKRLLALPFPYVLYRMALSECLVWPWAYLNLVMFVHTLEGSHARAKATPVFRRGSLKHFVQYCQTGRLLV